MQWWLLKQCECWLNGPKLGQHSHSGRGIYASVSLLSKGDSVEAEGLPLVKECNVLWRQDGGQFLVLCIR